MRYNRGKKDFRKKCEGAQEVGPHVVVFLCPPLGGSNTSPLTLQNTAVFKNSLLDRPNDMLIWERTEGPLKIVSRCPFHILYTYSFYL